MLRVESLVLSVCNSLNSKLSTLNFQVRPLCGRGLIDDVYPKPRFATAPLACYNSGASTSLSYPQRQANFMQRHIKSLLINTMQLFSDFLADTNNNYYRTLLYLPRQQLCRAGGLAAGILYKKAEIQ